jgi:hypothetical protein
MPATKADAAPLPFFLASFVINNRYNPASLSGTRLAKYLENLMGNFLLVGFRNFLVLRGWEDDRLGAIT